MTARQVHAVLAAGVHNPELIARWRETPSLLAKQGVDPEAFDLEGLWKFSGLTIKVRHNGTRPDLPMTYRLMSFLGIEIELFASYATWCAENKKTYAKTAHERERDLIAYMEGWLDFEDAEHCLLWDLIRHEHAIASLKELEPGARNPARAGTVPEAASVPSVCGEIILHEMRFDPREIVEALKPSRPDFSVLEAAVRQFCYWLPEQAESIQVIGLDAFGYYLLSFVDGARSLADLGEQLGCGRELDGGFLQLVAQLCGLGILGVEKQPEVIAP